MDRTDRFVYSCTYIDYSTDLCVGSFDTICNLIERQLNKENDDMFKYKYPPWKSRGPPGAITWAPCGNHEGPQGQSRGPPVEITWAPRGNHVGPDRKSTRLNSSHNPSSRMPSSA